MTKIDRKVRNNPAVGQRNLGGVPEYFPWFILYFLHDVRDLGGIGRVTGECDPM